MHKLLAALIFVGIGCGAQAHAIEHAEVACLEADYASLKAKVAAGISSPEGTAIALSEGELVCAVEALGAKPAVVPADAGL